MVKKRLYKDSLFSLFIQWALFVTLFGVLYISVKFTIGLIRHRNDGYINFYTISTITFLYSLAIIIVLYYIFVYLFGRIILDQERIYCDGDKAPFSMKIQYPVSANYDEIGKLNIVAIAAASNGKKILLYRPIPYLRITKKNGENALLSLNDLSPRTVCYLLNELNKRCKSKCNDLQLDIEKMVDDFKKMRFATIDDE